MKSNILGSKLCSGHRKKGVNISIGDIRKMVAEPSRGWALVAITDKLEELENRISKIEDYLNKD